MRREAAPAFFFRIKNLDRGPGGSVAREEPYQRMPAPLWEARRSAAPRE
jgi:hypothetical protein